MLQTLYSRVLNHAVKSNDGYLPRAKVLLSYIYIYTYIQRETEKEREGERERIFLLRLIYHLAHENKIHKGLAWKTLEVAWRHNHLTSIKRELLLGFIVSSPLNQLMTEQCLSMHSIWDFTAAVYKWNFHDKQLYSVSLYIWKWEWSLKALLGRSTKEDKKYFRLFSPEAL